MLVLTRLKGQSVILRHSDKQLVLRYVSSNTGSAEISISGDLEDFEIDGYINTKTNPIRGFISREYGVHITRGQETLSVAVNYIRPERASICFDGPKSFIVKRDDYDSVL